MNLKRAFKWLAWIVATPILLVLAWLVLALVLTRFDEAPTPRLAAIRAQASAPPDLADSNGYLWFYGLQAPEGKVPLEWAREVIKAHLAGNFKAGADGATLSDANKVMQEKLRCKDDMAGVNCLEWTAARSAEYALLLADTKQFDERYLQMLATDHVTEVLSPEPDFPFAPYRGVGDAGQRLMAQAFLKVVNGDAKGGLEMLDRKARFESRAMASSRSLIGKMVWTSYYRRSLLALSHIAQARPALAAQIAALPILREPLSSAALSMKASAEFETLFIDRTIQSIPNRPDVSMVEMNAGGLLGRTFGPHLIRLTGTSNLLSDAYQAADVWCAQPATDLEASLPALNDKLQGKSALQSVLWPRNVVGEILYSIAVPTFNSYCYRPRDAEAQRRLTLAQSLLMADPKTALPADLVDPFTGKPFARDDAAGTLSYTNRSAVGNLPKTLVVQFRAAPPAPAAK